VSKGPVTVDLAALYIYRVKFSQLSIGVDNQTVVVVVVVVAV